MREAPLPDIIQLVSQGGKTGCFHVLDEARRAKIYLKGGRIVHAVTKETEGLEALFQVALWLDGTYHFEEVDHPVPVTINKPNPSVLMEMHRRMDEWRVISQKIASLELFPHSTLLPGERPEGVNPREARMLALVTGYYSIEELAALLERPVLNVAKDLYGLVMAGHVGLKAVRSGRKPDLPLPARTAEREPDLRPAAHPSPHPAAMPGTDPEPHPSTVPEAYPGTASEAGFHSAGGTPRPPLDPVRLAKLTHFAQRIVQTAKGVLPPEHHDMLNRLLARANLQLVQGEGPEAVKNLALAVSRGAVEAGCDGELVKTLNAHLKALFAK
jgi:hypothetical protein